MCKCKLLDFKILLFDLLYKAKAHKVLPSCYSSNFSEIAIFACSNVTVIKLVRAEMQTTHL